MNLYSRSNALNFLFDFSEIKSPFLCFSNFFPGKVFVQLTAALVNGYFIHRELFLIPVGRNRLYISLLDLVLTIIMELPIERMIFLQVPIMLANIKVNVRMLVVFLGSGGTELLNIVEHLSTGTVLHILRYGN